MILSSRVEERFLLPLFGKAKFFVPPAIWNVSCSRVLRIAKFHVPPAIWKEIVVVVVDGRSSTFLSFPLGSLLRMGSLYFTDDLLLLTDGLGNKTHQKGGKS